MNQVAYRNYHHYINEGWSNQPKRTFVSLVNLIKRIALSEKATILDVGCATGELIHYLSLQFPNCFFTGVDIFDDLIQHASKLQPHHTFLNASVLSLPVTFNNAFDLTIATGLMSVFDETTITLFFDNLLRVTKPKGTLIILSPLNEYGVDTMIRHRKRIKNQLNDWETGWNIFSQETITEILKNKCDNLQFIDFQIDLELPRKEDPVRTWTIETQFNDKQLTNGLKLLINHYFIILTKL